MSEKFKKSRILLLTIGFLVVLFLVAILNVGHYTQTIAAKVSAISGSSSSGSYPKVTAITDEYISNVGAGAKENFKNVTYETFKGKYYTESGEDFSTWVYPGSLTKRSVWCVDPDTGLGDTERGGITLGVAAVIDIKGNTISVTGPGTGGVTKTLSYNRDFIKNSSGQSFSAPQALAASIYHRRKGEFNTLANVSYIIWPRLLSLSAKDGNNLENTMNVTDLKHYRWNTKTLTESNDQVLKYVTDGDVAEVKISRDSTFTAVEGVGYEISNVEMTSSSGSISDIDFSVNLTWDDLSGTTQYQRINKSSSENTPTEVTTTTEGISISSLDGFLVIGDSQTVLLGNYADSSNFDDHGTPSVYTDNTYLGKVNSSATTDYKFLNGAYVIAKVGDQASSSYIQTNLTNYMNNAANNPSGILINMGANGSDGYSSLVSTLLAKYPGKPIFLTKMPYAGNTGHETTVNAIINNLANNNDSVYAIDTTQSMRDGSGKVKATYLESDALHFKPSGCKEWLKGIKAALSSVGSTTTTESVPEYLEYDSVNKKIIIHTAREISYSKIYYEVSIKGSSVLCAKILVLTGDTYQNRLIADAWYETGESNASGYDEVQQAVSLDKYVSSIIRDGNEIRVIDGKQKHIYYNPVWESFDLNNDGTIDATDARLALRLSEPEIISGTGGERVKSDLSNLSEETLKKERNSA